MNKKIFKTNNSNRKIRVLPFILSKVTALMIVIIIIINMIIFVPSFFGYQVFDVISGSMEPAIKVNSLIYVQETKPQDLVAGDIITYTSNKGIITHRVVINDINAQEIITKGDNNLQVDLQPIAYRNIIGKVFFTIPYLGYYVSFISSLFGKILVIIIVVFCFIIREIVK